MQLVIEKLYFSRTSRWQISSSHLNPLNVVNNKSNDVLAATICAARIDSAEHRYLSIATSSAEATESRSRSRRAHHVLV